MSAVLAFRVAWKHRGGITDDETREDYPDARAANARAEGLRADGLDVVTYRIDLEEAG